MTQTNPDPSLTHTFTTRDAGEKVKVSEHERVIHRLRVRVENLEIGKKQAEEAWRDEHTNAFCLANDKIDLTAEVERLRAKLARAETIEAAADELLDYFAGMNTQSNYLLNLIDQLKAAKEEPTLTDEFHKAADIEAETPTTAGSGLIGHRGGFATSLDSSAPDYAILYSHEADPTPTPTEAEVERLRGEVDRLKLVEVTLRQTGVDDAKQILDQQQKLLDRETRIEEVLNLAETHAGRAERAEAEIDRLKTEAKQLKADADRSIEINNGLEREVALLNERLQTRIKMTDQLHEICDQREQTIAALCTANEGSNAAISRQHQQIKDREVAMGLFLADLRTSQDREVEARRTIADLRAKLDALVGAVGKLEEHPDNNERWYAIKGSNLKAALAAADAARQPTEAAEAQKAKPSDESERTKAFDGIQAELITPGLWKVSCWDGRGGPIVSYQAATRDDAAEIMLEAMKGRDEFLGVKL